LFPALNGIARIYITGGDVLVGGDELDSRYYVLLESKPLIDEKKYQDGWAIQLGDSAHWPVFGGRKTGSYAIQSRAYKNSQSADNVDEVLLFTESSELISGAFSNVFVIREDRFITPGVSNGARDGVIREWVCKNYEVTEQSITRDELEDIDEVFLANSRIGIMPASSINRRQLSMKMGFHIHRDYDGFVGRAFSGHT
jgi:branched-subunit amino acid aminotransferase/4-amino-4-deoxychorismate lyase